MSPRTNRRVLAKGLAASIMGSAMTPGGVIAQATPVMDVDLLDLSQRLVAMGDLDPSAVPFLSQLVVNDDPDGSGLRELAALPDYTMAIIQTTSEHAQGLAKNILAYWFIGRWDGRPVDNTADRFFDFSVWGILPYSTVPTLCKGYAYWAQPLGTEPEQS